MRPKQRIAGTTTLFCILMAFAACDHQTAMQKAWLVAYYPTQYRALVQKADIVLKNNDTLRGNIKFTMIYNYYPVIPDGQKWLESSIVRIRINNIAGMRVYDDSTRNNHFSDYVRTDEKRLWRLVGKKNNLELCDNFLKIAGAGKIRWCSLPLTAQPGYFAGCHSWRTLQTVVH